MKKFENTIIEKNKKIQDFFILTFKNQRKQKCA